jgi:hypothetical protein
MQVRVKKPSQKRKRIPRATAFHRAIDTKDGSVHVVGVGDLRVIVLKTGDFWFARGLDIDYAAQGLTLQEVKRNFERGLEQTIDRHLQVFGNIERLLSPTPPDAWKKLVYSPSRSFRYSQVSTHRLSDKLKSLLKSEAISFIRPQTTAA